jgi:hypothetical protein
VSIPATMVSIGATDNPSGTSVTSLGVKVDLPSLATEYEISRVENLPSNEFNEILILVHPLDMLLEIVQPRPYLSLVPAGVGSTLVRFSLKADSVHTLFMPIKIVCSCKALLRSLALWKVARERLFVSQFMLSTHASAKYFDHWARHALVV